MAIGKGTEYFTSFDYGPTVSIKDRARTGPATVIIQGIGVGMISTILPTIFLAIAILVCAALSDEYGVAMAAVGMLGTLAISLSTDAYGPVADNAGVWQKWLVWIPPCGTRLIPLMHLEIPLLQLAKGLQWAQRC